MAEDREDVYTKKVRAGKRTYFFDVRSTRRGDLYLIITESKKHTHPDGSATYDKHKVFLYKEDFDKFLNGLHDAIDEIDRLRSNGFTPPEPFSNGQARTEVEGQEEADGPEAVPATDITPFSDLDFEDLDRKDI